MSTLLANFCETTLADMPFLYVKYCPLKHGNVIYNTPKDHDSLGNTKKIVQLVLLVSIFFLVNGTVPLSSLLDYRAVP